MCKSLSCFSVCVALMALAGCSDRNVVAPNLVPQHANTNPADSVPQMPGGKS